MSKISYTGSKLGSCRTNGGRDMTYYYPPSFVMTFPNYRKQSSWDRDAILNKALLAYVNREPEAPKVVWDEGRPTLENLEDMRDAGALMSIEDGIPEGANLTAEAEALIIKAGVVTPIAETDTEKITPEILTGNGAGIGTIPIILVAVFIGVLMVILGVLRK